jgi:hypothetical protein
MKRWHRLLLIAALATAGCGGSNPTQPPGPPNDETEPNDFVAQSLGALTGTDIVFHGSTASGSDVDLFTVSTASTVNLYASLEWTSGSDLELTLSDQNGVFVRHVDTTGHPESCTLPGLGPGTYTIRVGSLTDVTTLYTLTIGRR